MQHRLAGLFGGVFLIGAVVCAACSDGSSGATDGGSGGSGSGSSSSGLPATGDAADVTDAMVSCTPDESASFVPQPSDFTGFCNWPNAPAMAEGDASDGLHGVGPLRVYWNKSPPHGCGEFPVGTIIIKETEESVATVRTVFAMVKRNARGNPKAFNAGGAPGWDWWSLTDNGDCTMSKLWMGELPPAGESYTGTAAGDCNGCHGLAKDNDYVWSTALQLSNF
jgi:hypothetical protein